MTDDWRARIKQLLKERRLSMKEASRRAGRGETFVRDILERGQTPSTAHMDALARVLGISLGDLHGEPTDEIPPSGRKAVPATSETVVQLAEVFSELLKADERTQRQALSALREIL